ncbi:MAG: hypothetical protein KGK14_07815 [Bacteroidota bacterium]|nr:hypothetical protein [Bacteroidota bacterium]
MLSNINKLMILAFLVAITSLMACKKEGHEKHEPKILCRTIAVDSIPLAVRDSFFAKYIKIIPLQWFVKDSVGYCAHFMLNGKEELALFSNSGILLDIETKIEQTGQYEDTTGQQGKFFKEGCSCEINKEND